jgi:ankyrin repeat protein
VQNCPLLVAAEKGHTECVFILLKKGIDIDRKINGRNHLMLAIEKGHWYVGIGRCTIRMKN